MAKVINLIGDDRIYNTSFHDATVTSTVNEIASKLGIPFINYGYDGDKVTHEFNLELDGIVCTIYDWKEYRDVSEDDVLRFHIGTATRDESEKVASILAKDYGFKTTKPSDVKSTFPWTVK